MIEADFDRLVDEAWPAPGRIEADSWVYRHAGGVTKRANSVLPLGRVRDLGEAVEHAERFYRRLGLPVVFSMGPGAPAALDGFLAARGYRLAAPTLIMTRPLHPPGEAEPEPPEVALAAAPAPEWVETWWQVDGRPGRDPETARKTAERILTGINAAYASIGGGRGGAVAVGRGVTQRRWVGVYCMAVLPEARRAGHGQRILRALLSDGRRQGAEWAYLLVTEANTAARALYERAGFAVSGRYHYRTR